RLRVPHHDGDDSLVARSDQQSPERAAAGAVADCFRRSARERTVSEHGCGKLSPMTIIDSQVHAYEANTPRRPWLNVPNWPPHVTGDEMVAAMDRVGVDGSIFISAFSLYQ